MKEIKQLKDQLILRVYNVIILYIFEILFSIYKRTCINSKFQNSFLLFSKVFLIFGYRWKTLYGKLKN